MAHTITWQCGDGKCRYQPVTAGDRLWLSQDVMRPSRSVWSRNGHEYSPVAEAITGAPSVQLEPKLYRWKWRALWVARSEEKRRAKATVTEVHEVKGQ